MTATWLRIWSLGDLTRRPPSDRLVDVAPTGPAIRFCRVTGALVLPNDDRMRGRWLLLAIDLLCAAILIGLGLLWAANARENRVALVIGNSEYQNVGKLPNPANDAAAVADLLKRAGFAVELRRDLANADLRQVIRDFSGAVRAADIAVIYYAGHGVEVNGENYLIPVDAKLEPDTDAVDVEDKAVSLHRVLAMVEPARRLRLILLEACRDNPFGNTTGMLTGRRIGRGLAGIELGNSDTLIALAAKAGSTAIDGEGPVSPFTSALLNYIAKPGLDVRLALGLAHDEVLAKTGRQQEPFVYGSLSEEAISLVPAPAVSKQPDTAPPTAVDSPEWHDTVLHQALTRVAQAKMRAANVRQSKAAQDSDKQGEGEDRPTDLALQNGQVFHNPAEDFQLTKVEEPNESKAASPPLVPSNAAGLTEPDETAGITRRETSATATHSRALAASRVETGGLARLVQMHLRRVGCDPSKINGDWNWQSRRALEAFNKQAGTELDSEMASLEALDVLQSKTSRICPPVCDHGSRVQGDHCVGVEKQSRKKLATHRARREQSAPKPPSSAAPPVPRAPDPPDRPAAPPSPPSGSFDGGKKCHTLMAHVFCD